MCLKTFVAEIHVAFHRELHGVEKDLEEDVTGYLGQCVLVGEANEPGAVAYAVREWCVVVEVPDYEIESALRLGTLVGC